MSLEEQVIQAVARGWCHPDNSHKVMDVDLAKAIAAEVVKSFSPAPPENNVRAMPDDVDVTGAAMVEVVARAIHDADQANYKEECVDYESCARAAIAAMLPALDAARKAGRREGIEQSRIAAGQAAWRHEGHDGYSKAMDGAAVQQVRSCVDAIRALIPAARAPMEAATDLPDHEDVRGILGDPPHAIPAQALGGAAFALEMCEATMNAETAFSGALAKAAIIAYLSLTGRDAEAEKVSHVEA